MKKRFVSLLMLVMIQARAAGASIDTTVVGLPGTDSNGGVAVLESMDQKCRY
jgi:hypothetical protein